MKNKRQNTIIDIVKSKPMRTHDELIDALRKEGVSVTQATVSRDIKELGIIKVPSGDGSSVYAMPEMAAKTGRNRVDMVSDSVRRVSSALHTIVINTLPGMAPAVAATVDALLHNDILGSVAGDDTVIVITATTDDALRLEGEIKTAFRM